MAAEGTTPLETTQGYATPTVTQFSVFLDNRVGKLHELVGAFERSAAKICALSVHEASDHAVVRLITNRAAIASRILREQDLPYAEKEVIVVELSEGHSLESLCLSLLGAELNIFFAYPLMLRPNGSATIALSVDDMTLAGQILRRKEFRLFGEGDLAA
ncbi:MAG: acetolactate synthase [Planctomycetota bacterium]